jgi:hypothetical protein
VSIVFLTALLEEKLELLSLPQVEASAFRVMFSKMVINLDTYKVFTLKLHIDAH